MQLQGHRSRSSSAAPLVGLSYNSPLSLGRFARSRAQYAPIRPSAPDRRPLHPNGLGGI